MCRLIGYRGRSEADLKHLYAAFQTGSGCDPYLAPAGMSQTCHPHGYGYVIFDTEKGLHHFRSERPAYEEPAPLPPVKGLVYAVFHSRLASDPNLSGHIFSHPFMAATQKGALFLAHNGGVEPDQLPGRMVDSEWALQRIVDAGSIEGALPLLKSRTKKDSALNLMLLAIPRAGGTQPSLYYLNYYQTDNPGKQDYYRMFWGDMPGGKVVFSSTFKDLAIPGLGEATPAPFGELKEL